jgi:hypothetical protein
MKKPVKKIHLSRETLLRLDKELEAAVGGSPPSDAGSCSGCHTAICTLSACTSCCP